METTGALLSSRMFRVSNQGVLPSEAVTTDLKVDGSTPLPFALTRSTLRNKSGAPSRWVIVNGSFTRSTARMCGDSLSCCSSRSTILRQNGCGLSDNSSTRPELKVAYSGAVVECPLVMLERVSVFPTSSLGILSELRVFSLTNRRTRKATTSAVKPMRAHDLNSRDSFTVFDDYDAYLLKRSLFVGPTSLDPRSIEIFQVQGSRGVGVRWSLGMTIAGS